MLGDVAECYIDDLVVKLHQRMDHLKHLEIVLDKLRQHIEDEPTKMRFRAHLRQMPAIHS